jgi:hypothetical protein
MNMHFSKGRRFFTIGAVLVLISMALPAFTFNESGSDTITGYTAWYLGISPIIQWHEVQHDLFMRAMLICSLGNIPQIVYPFLSSRKAGTSPIVRFTYFIIAFIILPVTALFVQFGLNDNHLFVFRIGYFLYQAGYIFTWFACKTNYEDLNRNFVPLAEMT